MVNLTKSTKSVSVKDIKREWHLLDVNNKVLGRAATEISGLLQGKSKTTYVPYLDSGDYVVVVNAKKIVVTGKKKDEKIYTQYSGYPGGLRKITFKEMMIRRPTEAVYRAVSGMLPKNKLRDRRLARLYIYPEDKHPYENKLKK